LAMTAGVRLGAISATIHAYPTLSQVHRRAVNAGLGKRLFSRGTRRLVRMIHRLLP
ncbi:MAG TPA: pyridine nucleotide-disulfide oxidoreductase, partial [Chromatiales bacterium]|nr:pyridine nucleotide-disulfide oxidoreductase [Chromatiales bacterium]